MVIALIGLVILAPVLMLAALAIALGYGRPVLFRQCRVGRGGRHFALYKFRTMNGGLAGPQVTSGDDRRVTRLGHLLRKSKIDELPELWNVCRGDMSLVGPRPEVPRYVNLADARWQAILQARPGITDPMTMRLRNEETLLAEVEGDRELFYIQVLQPFKLRGYLEYLQTRSWWRDLKILFMTLVAIILPGKAVPPTPTEIAGFAGKRMGIR